MMIFVFVFRYNSFFLSDGSIERMIWTSTMGNTTNNLSLCVSHSSKKTRRERPYVSRPFWPYEYEHRLNLPTHMPSNSPIRELSPMRLSPTVLHENSQSPSLHIVRKISRN